jgi:Protein of unknown function (DUF1189)
MKRYNSLHALVLSFYSADLYRDVAKNWKGIGLLHLLLLLAVTWAPTAIRTFGTFKAFVDEKGAAIAQQMPAVSIKDGVMSATPSGRHEIKDAGTGEIFMIIDDTVDTVPSNLTGDVGVLTRREFGTFNERRNERRVWELQPGFSMALTPARVEQFIGGMPYWGVPILYLVLLVGSLAFRTGQILLYGNIGMFFAKRFNAPIDYKAAVRIAAIAVTPVIVLRTLIWFTPGEPRWYIRWPIGLIIAILLIRFGVKAAAQPEPTGTVPT